MKYKCSRVTYLNCRVAYCLFNIGEYVVKYGYHVGVGISEKLLLRRKFMPLQGLQ
uniref:Uncharacterized protein n=1 Tax=Anguilla anguilla TaxID=7936 RepID=A0A0E9STH3_ANGAN